MYSFTSFYKGPQCTGIDEETIKNMVEKYHPLKYGENDHIEPYKKAYAIYSDENKYLNMAYKWFWWFPPFQPTINKETGEIFHLNDTCIAFVRNRRNKVNYLWRISDCGDIMSYIRGGSKLQIEFTFKLPNDELTASCKKEECVIFESRYFKPSYGELQDGSIRFREMRTDLYK